MKKGILEAEEFSAYKNRSNRSFLHGLLMKQGDSICITVTKPFAMRENLKEGDRVEVAFYWKYEQGIPVEWFIFEQEIKRLNSSLVVFVPPEAEILPQLKDNPKLDRSILVSFAKFHILENNTKNWSEAVVHGTMYDTKLSIICPYCGVENKDVFEYSAYDSSIFMTGDTYQCNFCNKKIEVKPILKFRKI